MALSAYATRSELGLGNLVLTSSTLVGYHLTTGALRDIAVTWRRHVTTSPEVHGAVVNGAVMDLVHQPVEVACFAASFAALKVAVADVIRCFTQWNWELHIAQDGTDYVAWRCGVSDYATDMDETYQFGRLQVVRFTLERQPVPLAGAY